MKLLCLSQGLQRNSGLWKRLEGAEKGGRKKRKSETDLFSGRIPGERLVQAKLDMKGGPMKLLLIAVVVVLGFGWDGQAMAAETKPGVSAEDVKKDTKEALETTKEYTVQQKEEFQKKMRAQLDRMQKRIDQLTAKANRAKTDAQAELKKATAELQEQKDAAGKKLKELESATGKAWSDLKSGLNATVEELEKSYKRARARFS
jgi:TolA-binding protein